MLRTTVGGYRLVAEVDAMIVWESWSSQQAIPISLRARSRRGRVRVPHRACFPGPSVSMIGETGSVLIDWSW
jgi:hypothetical protein